MAATEVLQTVEVLKTTRKMPRNMMSHNEEELLKMVELGDRKCDICEKAFSSKQNLTTHIRRFHKNTQMVCPWPGCFKQYKHRWDLSSHERVVHKGEKVMCDNCGNCFSKKSNLYNHLNRGKGCPRRQDTVVVEQGQVFLEKKNLGEEKTSSEKNELPKRVKRVKALEKKEERETRTTEVESVKVTTQLLVLGMDDSFDEKTLVVDEIDGDYNEDNVEKNINRDCNEDNDEKIKNGDEEGHDSSKCNWKMELKMENGEAKEIVSKCPDSLRISTQSKKDPSQAPTVSPFIVLVNGKQKQTVNKDIKVPIIAGPSTNTSTNQIKETTCLPIKTQLIASNSSNDTNPSSDTSADTNDSKSSADTFASTEDFPSALHFLAEIASGSDPRPSSISPPTISQIKVKEEVVDLKFDQNGFQVSSSEKSDESEEYKKEEQSTNTGQVVFNQKVVINQNHPTFHHNSSATSPNSLLMPVHSQPQVNPIQPQNAPQFIVSASNPKILIPIQSQPHHSPISIQPNPQNIQPHQQLIPFQRFINPQTGQHQLLPIPQQIKVEHPTQNIQVQQPTQQFQVHQPTQNIQIQQPIQQFQVQQPNQQLQIQQPTQQIQVQQPNQQIQVQQPTQQIQVQQPTQPQLISTTQANLPSLTPQIIQVSSKGNMMYNTGAMINNPSTIIHNPGTMLQNPMGMIPNYGSLPNSIIALNPSMMGSNFLTPNNLNQTVYVLPQSMVQNSNQQLLVNVHPQYTPSNLPSSRTPSPPAFSPTSSVGSSPSPSTSPTPSDGVLRCPQCGRVCSTPSHLSNHIKSVHMAEQGNANRRNKEKKLKCDYCAKLFGRNSHLTEHIKSVHEGVKRVYQKVTCPHCGRVFARQCSLNLHISAAHGSLSNSG